MWKSSYRANITKWVRTSKDLFFPLLQGLGAECTLKIIRVRVWFGMHDEYRPVCFKGKSRLDCLFRSPRKFQAKVIRLVRLVMRRV